MTGSGEGAPGPLGYLRDIWGHAALRLAPGDVLIRYRPGRRAEVRGRVPASKQAGIAAFLAHDLRPGGPLTIRGRFGPGPAGRGPLRLAIAGRLSAGDRQRLRNFLVQHLA